MTTLDDRLANARKAVDEHLSRRSDVKAAFLAGSVVEGFGNPTSDIDVLVLSDEERSTSAAAGPGRFRFEECVVEIVHASAERLDIETRSLADLHHELRRLDELPATQQGSYEVNAFTVQFLHQMRVGRPVVGHALLQTLRDRVDWDRLVELLRIRHEADYGSHAEDAAGAIQHGDAGTALLASRRALGSAMDCLIVALGHTNPKEKWRYRKLADLGRIDLVQRCLEVECDPDPSPEAMLRSARQRLLAAQDLVAQAARARRP